MKSTVNFSLINIVSLEDIFEKGLIGYYVDKSPDGSPDCVWLQTASLSIVMIYSRINEFDNWYEAGNLCFKVIKANTLRYSMIHLDEGWLKIKQLSKLLLIEEKIRVECGVKVVNKNI